MNKKVIALIIAILVIALGALGYFIINSNNSNKEKNQNTNSNNNLSSSRTEENNTEKVNNNNSINNNTQNETKTEETSNKKVAVVYFSATGTTKTVAEYISAEVNGDIFEIVPKQKYSSSDLNWNDNSSRSTKEQNDKNARPEIQNNIDVSSYDVIFIGYPIWWGDTPRIIQSFMESHELNGKTMIPFCTSGGSGIQASENTLKSYKEINWVSGKRLEASKSEITNWINSLNY